MRNSGSKSWLTPAHVNLGEGKQHGIICEVSNNDLGIDADCNAFQYHNSCVCKCLPYTFSFSACYKWWKHLSYQWPFLLIWFDFIPSMDKYSRVQYNVGWNHLCVLWLKLIHISKRNQRNLKPIRLKFYETSMRSSLLIQQKQNRLHWFLFWKTCDHYYGHHLQS